MAIFMLIYIGVEERGKNEEKRVRILFNDYLNKKKRLRSNILLLTLNSRDQRVLICCSYILYSKTT